MSTMRKPTAALPHMGEKLERLLVAKQCTQSQLARALGVSRQNILYLLASRVWRTQTIHRVSQILGVSPLYFFEK